MGSGELAVSHSVCDFRATVSYADLRHQPVVCPRCGKTLVSHVGLVETLEDELKRTAGIQHRHSRMQYRRDLNRVREQLLDA